MDDTVKATKKTNCFNGVLIIAIITLPMLAAYIMFKTGLGIPTSTSNKGTLLQPPRDIRQLSLNNQNHTLGDLISNEKKRWRILIPITKECDSSCQNHLYISRQVHIRLAEKAYRVERVLLLLDKLSSEATEQLTQAHPETIIIETTKTTFNQWLLNNNLPLSAENYYYLVNQSGFAMMRYDVSHKGQDLLDDIKKLLKFTYDN